jgi:hypothetical protein
LTKSTTRTTWFTLKKKGLRLNQLNWWWGAIEIAPCLREGTCIVLNGI